MSGWAHDEAMTACRFEVRENAVWCITHRCFHGSDAARLTADTPPLSEPEEAQPQSPTFGHGRGDKTGAQSASGSLSEDGERECKGEPTGPGTDPAGQRSGESARVGTPSSLSAGVDTRPTPETHDPHTQEIFRIRDELEAEANTGGAHGRRIASEKALDARTLTKPEIRAFCEARGLVHAETQRGTTTGSARLPEPDPDLLAEAVARAEAAEEALALEIRDRLDAEAPVSGLEYLRGLKEAVREKVALAERVGRLEEALRDAERIARMFHEAYERLAPDFGYETRRDSAVPWEDVPATNRALMIACAAEVGAALAGGTPPPDGQDGAP